ncbi:uncharacterized protein LOC119768862 [Culex quinquefasciatus]|uniref:uncharacterized protein LOC119768862 n=1 Tax=Culex quinquefasciatus TaxID=7176 RepID=UPI0018E2AFF0|nr:uncharacterized protein LOC119768862 [Culex quinquefasciatus]
MLFRIAVLDVLRRRRRTLRPESSDVHHVHFRLFVNVVPEEEALCLFVPGDNLQLVVHLADVPAESNPSFAEPTDHRHQWHEQIWPLHQHRVERDSIYRRGRIPDQSNFSRLLRVHHHVERQSLSGQYHFFPDFLSAGLRLTHRAWNHSLQLSQPTISSSSVDTSLQVEQGVSVKSGFSSAIVERITEPSINFEDCSGGN